MVTTDFDNPGMDDWLVKLVEKALGKCPKCGEEYFSFSHYPNFGNGKAAALFIHSYDRFGIVDKSCLIKKEG